jgi:hypothetical protein
VGNHNSSPTVIKLLLAKSGTDANPLGIEPYSRKITTALKNAVEAYNVAAMRLIQAQQQINQN